MNRGHHTSSTNHAGEGNINDSAAALMQRLSSLTLNQCRSSTVQNSHPDGLEAEAAAQLQLLLAKLATRNKNGQVVDDGDGAGIGYGNSFVSNGHGNAHKNNGHDDSTDYPSRRSQINEIGANTNWSPQKGSHNSQIFSTGVNSKSFQNHGHGNYVQQSRHSDPMPVRHSQYWQHQSHPQTQYYPQQHHHDEWQQHPPMRTTNHPPKTISQREKSFYQQERALLRELVVLTLRRSNGTMLRFVPSIEDQTAKIAQDSGYGNLFKFHRDVVAEGVRISPFVRVIPPSYPSSPATARPNLHPTICNSTPTYPYPSWEAAPKTPSHFAPNAAGSTVESQPSSPPSSNETRTDITAPSPAHWHLDSTPK